MHGENTFNIKIIIKKRVWFFMYLFFALESLYFTYCYQILTCYNNIIKSCNFENVCIIHMTKVTIVIIFDIEKITVY